MAQQPRRDKTIKDNSMEKNQYIRDIRANDDVDGLFLISAASLMQARNGPFWRLDLRDAGGTLPAKIWSPLSADFPHLQAGAIVHVTGRAGTYKDKIDVSIDTMTILSEAEIARLDMSDFMPSAGRSTEEMLAELQGLCADILTHKPWKKLVNLLWHDEELMARFLVAPGAKHVHHAYRSGLLEHTLSVAKVCLAFADLYPELDKQILLVAAICHDLGKAWELSGELAPDYTDEGRLLGHIYIGMERVEPYIRKCGVEEELGMHLRHLILSHHGEYEFGSPRRPKTPEAMALHFADNMDAKMAQLRGLFGDMTDDESRWTPFQATLQRYLYKPVASPTPAGSVKVKAASGAGLGEKDAAKQAEKVAEKQDLTPKATQCSLLSKE